MKHNDGIEFRRPERISITVDMARSDVPNAGGDVYPRHVLERAVEEFNASSRPLLLLSEVPRTAGIPLSSAVGAASDVRLDPDGRLRMQVTPFDDRLRDVLLSGRARYTTMGTGTVRDGVVQDDYLLMAIVVQMEE